MLFGCTEKDSATAPIRASSNESSSIAKTTMADFTQEYLLNVSRESCCNALYPPYDRFPNDVQTIDLCQDGNDVDTTALKCAWIWAHLVPYNHQLNSLACDTITGEYTAAVKWITGTTSNYHPSLTWDFVFGDGYKIKRKIGSLGRWSTVMTDTVRGDTTWIDSSIDVRTIEDPVYYKVYSKVYIYYASTGPEKIYYPSK